MKILNKHTSEVILEIKDLHSADLHSADLYDADLYDADLRGADLRGANLYGANLRDANLYCANLYGANLHDADLRDANLRYADLRDANLYGANLHGADLRDVVGNSREVKSLQLETYSITYTSKVLQIGCEQYLIEDWFKFDDNTISGMDSQALKFWKKWKDIIKQIVEMSPCE